MQYTRLVLRVMLVDDQTLFRKGLRRLLEGDGRFEVVAECGDGRSALDVFATARPDVVITDFVMPQKDGLDLCKDLRHRFDNVNILVLTMHADVDHASRVLRAGACGFLAKDAEPAEFLEAVATVARGERYLERGMAMALLDRKMTGADSETGLTDREFQVMRLIAAGLRSRDIAKELSVSQKTVDSHRLNVLKKLGLETSVDIAHYGLRNGYIEA